MTAWLDGKEHMLDAEFVEDLPSQPLETIRGRLRQAEAVELRLSYARRLLHARLDMLRGELDRRAGSGSGSLLDRLTGVLADRPGPRRGVHAPVPTIAADLQEQVEHLLPSGQLARLPDMDDREVSGLVETLGSHERGISELRRSVHSVIDTLQAELVRRYKGGEAPPSGVEERP